MNEKDREIASRPPQFSNPDTMIMRNLLFSAAAFLGLAVAALATPTAAFAQHFHGYYYPTYHNTSHYDYHPAQLVPHGNHFHHQPAHYDFHPSGHWSYGYGGHFHP